VHATRRLETIVCSERRFLGQHFVKPLFALHIFGNAEEKRRSFVNAQRADFQKVAGVSLGPQ
jgi:hypothetical protein